MFFICIVILRNQNKGFKMKYKYSIPQLIKMAGGAEVVRQALGLEVQTVYQWVTNRHIPQVHRLPLLRLLSPYGDDVRIQDIDNACTGRDDKNV
jgi:hypothetical protein